jgi:hypothetical protein
MKVNEPVMDKDSDKEWAIPYDSYKLYNQIKVNGAFWKKYQEGGKVKEDGDPDIPKFDPLEVRVYDTTPEGID